MRQVKLQKKIKAATDKAKELGISNDKPKVKGAGAASSYQPSKLKGENVPMGGGSKPKEYKSFDDMPKMKMKQTKTYKG